MSGSSRAKGGEPDPRIGSLLADRYRIDALVGEGGMGKVYSAEHVLMRKRLAVKVLRRELSHVPDIVARFEREAMAAGNIEHPNVAGATDFGKLPDGSVFLVLEFVSGHSLRDEMARAVFPVERALHITRQIAGALSAAHARGIVHRDLKPENVMLVEKGGDPDFVKVLDFGIAKVPLDPIETAAQAGNPLTKAGMIFGTPEYMAPEQALGQNVDGRADLYAVGVILFEMLSGVRPFTSESSVGILGQQLSKLAPTIAERAPGISVPPAAERIVRQLLDRESAARYQNASELGRAIDLLLAPIPAQGSYRFTLADASRPLPAESLARASSPSVPPLAAPISNAFKSRLLAIVRAFEHWRRRWPAGVRVALRRVPTPALLFALSLATVLTAVLLTALGFRVVRSLRIRPNSRAVTAGSASAMPSAAALPAAITASESAVADAVKGGLPRLEALLQRYPQDARLSLQLAHAALEAKDYVKAAGWAARTLSLDPRLADDQQLASVLFQSAQVKPASEASFASLFGAMGQHGADIVYDLAATESVERWVRVRADSWLRSPSFAKVSTPALGVAVALRFAGSCPERAALLARAKAEGDLRALGYLNRYRATTGCGWKRRNDCFACMHGDGRLREAIGAIKQRLPP